MSDGKPTRQELHRVIELATADLARNPRDQNARNAAAQALDALREWAATTGPAEAHAADQADLTPHGSAVGAYLTNMADLPTLGLADKISGAMDAIGEAGGGNDVAAGIWNRGRPVGDVGRAYREGRDQFNEYRDVASADHPTAAAAGFVTGGIVPTGRIGEMLGAGEKLAAGGRAAATVKDIRMARLAGAAATGIPAGVAGFVAPDDASFSDRMKSGLADLLLSGVAGYGATGLANNLARRTATAAARGQFQASRAAITALDLRSNLSGQGYSPDEIDALIPKLQDNPSFRPPPPTQAASDGMSKAERDARAGLQRMGHSPEGVDAGIERMRRTVGNPLYDPALSPPAPPSLRPSRPVEPPVGEAQAPGEAMHDDRGRIIPGTQRAPAIGPILPPSGLGANPDASASAAHVLADAAGQDANAAAARSAAMARDATSIAPDAEPGLRTLTHRDDTFRLQAILTREPTLASIQRLQDFTGTLSDADKAVVRDAVNANPKWRIELSRP